MARWEAETRLSIYFDNQMEQKFAAMSPSVVYNGSVTATGPKVRGFKPEDDGIFNGDINP
jgi:hypothetical protein